MFQLQYIFAKYLILILDRFLLHQSTREIYQLFSLLSVNMGSPSKFFYCHFQGLFCIRDLDRVNQ